MEDNKEYKSFENVNTAIWVVQMVMVSIVIIFCLGFIIFGPPVSQEQKIANEHCPSNYQQNNIYICNNSIPFVCVDGYCRDINKDTLKLVNDCSVKRINGFSQNVYKYYCDERFIYEYIDYNRVPDFDFKYGKIIYTK